MQIIQPFVGNSIVFLEMTSALKVKISFVYILGDHVIMIDWHQQYVLYMSMYKELHMQQGLII